MHEHIDLVSNSVCISYYEFDYNEVNRRIVIKEQFPLSKKVA